MYSVLDERFTLNDLLEPAILKEICLAFSQCFNLGLLILSDKEAEIIAVGQERAFCQIFHHASQPPKCEEVRKKLVQHPVDAAARVFQSKAFCGMRYALFPLYHQFEYLGRVILGPFRDPQTSTETIQSLAQQELGRTLPPEQIELIPVIDQEKMKSIIRLLTKILESFLFINAKRLITTRLHLETIYSSRDSIFRQMELQSSGTPEDKEEIEKLKSIF